MRTSLIPAVAFCLAAVFSASRGPAQQPAAPSGGPPAGGVLVAVIDVGYVFKHHAVFHQQMEKIKAEVKGFDEKVKQQQSQIGRKNEQLVKLPPGSPEYRRLEEEITRAVSDLKVQAALKKKELLNQEAMNYYQAYNDVVTAVDSVANRYGIGLVLRFERENIDPTNRGSVLRGVNRAVVFQRSLDISQLVLDQLQAPSARMTNLPDGQTPQRR